MNVNLFIFTSDTSLPHCIGVLEAWDYVFGDSKCKPDAVMASVFECEEAAFGFVCEWNWEDKIRPAPAHDCEA